MPNVFRATVLTSLLIAPTALMAQAPIKGEAILQHQLGVMGTKAAEVLAAGQFDAYTAMRTKEDQDDWKKQSAADKKDYGERLKSNAPTPAGFADMVRTAGELTINGDSAMLEATTAAGALRQMFRREGGAWRISFGPYFEPELPPAVRVEGSALASHPSVAVVLGYNDLVQAGKMDEALAQFGSAKAQAAWRTQPASEKRESAAFRKRMLPTRAQLTQSIRSGGLLLVEGDTATLNVIKIDPATASQSTGTSTTVAIPLTLEGGVWKIAQ